MLLSGVSLTGGYRAVGQRDRLARERCLSERVTSPQVVGPAQVFAGFRVPFCRPSVVRVGSAVGHRVNDFASGWVGPVMLVVSTVGFGLGLSAVWENWSSESAIRCLAGTLVWSCVLAQFGRTQTVVGSGRAGAVPGPLCFVFFFRCAPHRRELVSGCTPQERARIWLQEPHSVEVSLVSFLLGLPSTV